MRQRYGPIDRLVYTRAVAGSMEAVTHVGVALFRSESGAVRVLHPSIHEAVAGDQMRHGNDADDARRKQLGPVHL